MSFSYNVKNEKKIIEIIHKKKIEGERTYKGLSQHFIDEKED